MSHDFEDELERRFKELPGPEGEDAMIAGTVGRAMRARRRRHRRRVVAGAVSLTLLLSGGAFAVSKYDDGDGLFGFGGSSEVTQKRISTPELQGLPWLWQSTGGLGIDAAPAGAPSLEFEEGTSYEQAARSVYLSAVARGELPDGARVREPLPRGIVLDQAEGRVRLSLAAPFGYDPASGRVRVPWVRLPAGVPSADATAIYQSLEAGERVSLPGGTRIAWPRPLPACQVVSGPGDQENCPFVAGP